MQYTEQVLIRMERPTVDEIVTKIDALVSCFDSHTLTYLDKDGSWRRNPTTLKQRISNELFYTLWKNRNTSAYKTNVVQLVTPFVRDDKAWNVVSSIYNHTLSDDSGNGDSFNIFLQTLYHFIELEVYRTNGSRYVADWDYERKKRRSLYFKKWKESENAIVCVLEDKAIPIFNDIVNRLRKEKPNIFSEITHIIVSEGNIRSEIDTLIVQLRDAVDKEVIYGYMCDLITTIFSFEVCDRSFFLRPCLELLMNPEIEVSSGVQFKAAMVLGTLSDPRSIETTLTALQTFDRKYTNIRYNLIYSLGKLRPQESTDYLIDILDSHDREKNRSYETLTTRGHLLHLERQEAIWALGRLGASALASVPLLRTISDDRDKETRLYLSWAIGELGNAQKERYGGIDAGIVITLLNLLTVDDVNIFEESATALKSLGLPDFLHTLYLHNIATLPTLALKPSRIGFYELSETLHYLLSIKRPVIMAVTGDSGTGKTYFCEAIADGFGDVRPSDILHLMRDNPAHWNIFNRMLGLEWLRAHVDEKYYQDYALAEDDDPNEYFSRFIEQYRHKKLIILDGWREEAYFHQVISTFYEKGYLDVVVNFRTTFSTRRLNLEEREHSLESVRSHLSCIEELALEETQFYREGSVLIYNLNNSVESRLNTEEIIETFRTRKIETWGEHVRIGSFDRPLNMMETQKETIALLTDKITRDIQKIAVPDVTSFQTQETRFYRHFSNDTQGLPNLLQTVRPLDIGINRIAFYTQGQLAFCGDDGTAGILVGFNDRIYFTKAHSKNIDKLAVMGSSLFTVDTDSRLKNISFVENMVSDFGVSEVPIHSIASYRGSTILTGHRDGSIRLWDLTANEYTILKGHNDAVTALAVDRQGKLYSGARDGELRIWDFGQSKVTITMGRGDPITALGLYPDGKIVIAVTSVEKDDTGGTKKRSSLRIVDTNVPHSVNMYISGDGAVNTLNVYYDGRIFVGLRTKKGNNFILVEFLSGVPHYRVIGGHTSETRDCITMGPRIVTSGSESESEHVLRIWGTERYVTTEREKLKLMPDSMERPPYYRTLF
jgi:WD40 repeat protein